MTTPGGGIKISGSGARTIAGSTVARAMGPKRPARASYARMRSEGARRVEDADADANTDAKC